FFANISNAQNNYSQFTYTLPEYSFSELRLDAQNLMHFDKSNNLSTGNKYSNFQTAINLSNSYFTQSQSVAFRYTAAGEIGYQLEEHFYPEVKGIMHPHESFTITNELIRQSFSFDGYLHNYLNKDNGFFLSTASKINYFHYNRGVSENHYDLKTQTALGVGWGRRIGLRSVAQAKVILSTLEMPESEEKLQEVSAVIEKYNNDYYTKLYHDSSSIQFCNEISRITDQPEESELINLILTSPIYAITEKFTGWEVELDYIQFLNQMSNEPEWPVHTLPDEINTQSDLQLTASYSYPFNLEKQLTSQISVNQNLQKSAQRGTITLFNTFFSIDHSYFWTTNFGGGIFHYYTPGVEDDFTYFLGASTSFAVFNQLVFNMSMSYSKQKSRRIFDNGAATELIHDYSENDIRIHAELQFYIL
ncbi:MAG: hypothetical protein HYV28_20905, partial [Ignavibacteriales bacterium]|nr:hypothetical protein [Ignavibacteriales bacterium]